MFCCLVVCVDFCVFFCSFVLFLVGGCVLVLLWCLVGGCGVLLVGVLSSWARGLVGSWVGVLSFGARPVGFLVCVSCSFCWFLGVCFLFFLFRVFAALVLRV